MKLASRHVKLACRRPGAILLEVLLSVALLVFGLSVVGLRVSTAADSARRDHYWTTSVLLAETVMSKLQGGDIQFKLGEDQVKGHFKIFYPGYSWRMKIRRCEIDDLFLVTLEIGYNELNAEAQKRSPEHDIDFEDDGTITMRTVYRLVPKPADLNLARDLGFDPEELELDAAAGASASGGGSTGGGSGKAAAALDPLSLALAAAKDFLTRHPELLTEGGGIDINAISKLEGPDLDEAMQLVQQLLGGGANLNEMKDDLADNIPSNVGGGGNLPGLGNVGGGDAGGNRPGDVGSGGDRGGNRDGNGNRADGGGPGGNRNNDGDRGNNAGNGGRRDLGRGGNRGNNNDANNGNNNDRGGNNANNSGGRDTNGNAGNRNDEPNPDNRQPRPGRGPSRK